MISPAFRKAEQARRRHSSVSPAQRGTIAYLCRITGVEIPVVYDGRKASKAIRRLTQNLEHLRTPTLFALDPATGSSAGVVGGRCG